MRCADAITCGLSGGIASGVNAVESLFGGEKEKDPLESIIGDGGGK